MRCVVQRVTEASVSGGGEEIGRIGAGMMVLIGVSTEDGDADLKYMAEKVPNLRIFDDENGVMNLSVMEAGGDILAVSQFTLMASTKKGNRPSYIKAAKPEISVPLYEEFCSEMELAVNKPIQRGVFGADMKVRLLNDGPVTIFIDSKNRE